MENNQTNEKRQDFELQAVPDSARKGFLPMFMIMMGFTFFSASMSAGGQLGVGLNMTKFICALLIGNAILGVYTGILGYIGCKTGLTLDLMARHAFGKKGSWLCSAIITFTQMGWFGVGIAMFSIPVAELTGIPVVVLVILAGGLMTASAYFGIKSLEIISWIAVPAVGILGCISVGLGVSSMGGIDSLFAAEPQNPITLATAITLVVGSFIRGGSVTGQADIFYIMIAQGLALPAIIVLGLNIWTTADNGLYSCGLGLSNITGYSKKKMVLVSGMIGIVASVWLYYNFTSWLTFMGYAIPPVGGVVITDYFMHQNRYQDNDTTNMKTAKWYAILAVVAGDIIGLKVPVGIGSVNSIIAACVIYFIGDKICDKGDRRIRL